MTFSFTTVGKLDKTRKYLERLRYLRIEPHLKRAGAKGVAALESTTPRESGETAASWGYEIVKSSSRIGIAWTNSNVVDGVNIAVILQYGHGTGTGGFVQGRNYIPPALEPVFEELAEDVRKVIRRV